MELLECLSATFIGFQESIYQQTFGSDMKSPVSVTVANLIMEDVEERSLTTEEVKHALLQKGLDFAPAPSRVSTARIVAAVEYGPKGVPEKKAKLARTRIFGAIVKARPPPVNLLLLPQGRKAFKTLQEDDHILVLTADREGVT